MPTETTKPMPQDPQRTDSIFPQRRQKRAGVAEQVCGGLIAASILGCVIIAAQRSSGLIEITVTALDKAAEPRDHNLPFVKKKESLPDYELNLVLARGGTIRLGSKPDTSAENGLTWHVSDPVSTADIASVRLMERDMVLSDSLAEVHLTTEPATVNGYRFEFVTQHSFSLGFKSFFGTPIGLAIVGGIGLAVMLLVLRVARLALPSFTA